MRAFWSTETHMNHEFTCTQAYRNFRRQVLQHMQTPSPPHLEKEITCNLSRGYVIRYTPSATGVMLLRYIDVAAGVGDKKERPGSRG